MKYVVALTLLLACTTAKNDQPEDPPPPPPEKIEGHRYASTVDDSCTGDLLPGWVRVYKGANQTGACATIRHADGYQLWGAHWLDSGHLAYYKFSDNTPLSTGIAS